MDVTSTFSVKSMVPELSEYSSELETYDDLYNFSIRNTDLFWGPIARARVQWFQDFNEVCNTKTFNGENYQAKWFTGGKLNVTVNCVDRHYLKNPNKVALIWERDEPGTQEYFTYRQLYETMNQIANMLKSHGLKKGDYVAFYVQTSNYAVAAMLACARIGVVHNCIYAEFPSHAVDMRINEAECVALITDNQGVRNGKKIELKAIADEAIKMCPTVKHMFVIDRTNQSYETNNTVINLRNEMQKYSKECSPEWMDSEDPLFINFTSGSTGKPKALVQTQAGFLVAITFMNELFVNSNNEIINLFAGDIAWIGAHAGVIYGPLSVGITSVLFDTSFLYPNADRYWETIERLKVTRFGSYPTNVRILMKQGDKGLNTYDLSSLKMFFVGGEPLDENIWRWIYEMVGKKEVTIADGWGATEFGGGLVARSRLSSSFMNPIDTGMKPFLGAEVFLLDNLGNEILPDSKILDGHLCVKSVWPAMARTILKNHDKYLDTYLRPFPGYFYTGDRGSYDSTGNLRITGREDDVILIKTLRIGSAELEEVVNLHESILESAVVDIPNKLLGWTPYAFVVVKANENITETELLSDIRKLVESRIADYAVPTHILILENLPKTRTGKIMRKVLRKIAENDFDNLGDLSALENAFIIDSIIEKHKNKYLN